MGAFELINDARLVSAVRILRLTNRRLGGSVPVCRVGISGIEEVSSSRAADFWLNCAYRYLVLFINFLT